MFYGSIWPLIKDYAADRNFDFLFVWHGREVDWNPNPTGTRLRLGRGGGVVLTHGQPLSIAVWERGEWEATWAYSSMVSFSLQFFLFFKVYLLSELFFYAVFASFTHWVWLTRWREMKIYFISGHILRTMLFCLHKTSTVLWRGCWGHMTVYR